MTEAPAGRPRVENDFRETLSRGLSGAFLNDGSVREEMVFERLNDKRPR
jgi:hypothetical protein